MVFITPESESVGKFGVLIKKLYNHSEMLLSFDDDQTSIGYNEALDIFEPNGAGEIV